MSDILIVDDERDIRELISDILRDEGYATRLAANSDQAVAELNLADTVALCVSHHTQVIRSNEGLIRAALAYSLS